MDSCPAGADLAEIWLLCLMVGCGLLSLCGCLVGQAVGWSIAQSVTGPSVVREFGGRQGSLNLRGHLVSRLVGLSVIWSVSRKILW